MNNVKCTILQRHYAIELKNETDIMDMSTYSYMDLEFPNAAQALACSMMAVAMSRVEDVCRWCTSTLDHILESGDQLYQDSYLHFRPPSKILNIEQVGILNCLLLVPSQSIN